MPKLKMTDAVVRQATVVPGQRVDFFDAHPRDRQRGLILRVSGSTDADGTEVVTRTWAVLTRVAGCPRLRRFTIGDFPGFGLAEAREEAGEILKQARRGIDPLEKRREEAVAKRAKEEDSIEALTEKFHQAMAKHPKKKGGKRSPNYLAEVKGNFDRHVLPRWTGHSIHSITRRDVSDLLDAVADQGTTIKGPDGKKRHAEGGPIASNRVLSALSKFFNWAVAAGVITLSQSPAIKLDKRGEEIARDRFLTDEEIQVVWPEFLKRGYPFGSFFRAALMTAQRRTEISDMRWSEIDEEKKIWTIPAGRAKARRTHVVPLSESVLALLADAKKQSAAIAKALEVSLGPYVFSSTGGHAPISGFSRAKTILDEATAKRRKEEKLAPIADWRIHDLRRSASTAMTKLGVSEFVVARILNHTREGVTKIYDRNDYLREMATALDLWGGRLAELTAAPIPTMGNVVTLKPRGARGG